MKRRALISVSDKTGIVAFAKELINLGFEIISTGGTKQLLDQAGVATIAIDTVTGFPEMLDGRVKTLHPNIHGGLLGKREDPDHLAQMKEHGIAGIDLVCVNLYPFKATIENPEASHEDIIENIDIGGPSMLRSAAKNYLSVTVIVDNQDFSDVLNELKTNGETRLETRENLAAKVFRHTASYDTLIATYLTKKTANSVPETLNLAYELKQTLRYGENNHQAASFYQELIAPSFSLAQAKQLHGKELSYNNIRDADAALRIIQDFEAPTVAVLKHMNPCGIGSGKTIKEAFDFAYDADSTSIFGGIVVLNREVDLASAKAMHDIFLEIILAPSFSEAAFHLLSQKKNIRLLTLDFSLSPTEVPKELVSVMGGVLVQEMDVLTQKEEDWQVVTKRQPTPAEVEALQFGWKAVKHVKSNAIIVNNAHQTLGVGAGQMNRVGSVKIALEQAKHRLEGAVLASDAFFPMSDSVEYAAEKGIQAIIQPGGSIKDQEVIDLADQLGMTMIFTQARHFKH